MTYNVDENIDFITYYLMNTLYDFITRDIYCNLILLSSTIMIIIYMTLTDNYTEYYNISKFLLNLYIFKQIIYALMIIKYKYKLSHTNIIIKIIVISLLYYYSCLFINK